MTIEQACPQVVQKPWGSTELRPWCAIDNRGAAIGEVWFQRADASAPDPALLLKLLFTTAPLSIQVHPDDTFARSIGLPHGKTEAWYILSATADAKIAIGLTRPATAEQLRAAIADGSIADLVQWRHTKPGDVFFVAAGTIHAIGAGLVLAEIQQRSEATFRLFDHGRQRALHVEDAVAAAHAGPAAPRSSPRRLSDARTLLVASPHFVLERLDLAPDSHWELQADPETWVLVVEGDARVGQTSAAAGDTLFLQDDCARIAVGSDGARVLLAYAAAEPAPGLLRRVAAPHAGFPRRGVAPPPSARRRLAGRVGARL